MATSGNPAKKAAAKKAAAKKAAAPKTASAGAFKQRRGGEDLQLPSELWIKAKRVELQTMVLQGAVPNALMEVVSAALEKGQKSDIPKMMGVEEGKIDLDMVNDMYEMVNAVVVQVFVEPKCYPVPEAEDDRDDDLLYVDEVDDTDKMFLFQWASGGTSDLERFREEADADMASLAEIQGAGATT